MNRSILPVFLALASLAAKPAVAAWTHDPSTNEPVCVAANHQNHPEVAADAAGNTFITWHDFRSGDYDIYVQKYSPKGVPQWGADGVHVPTNLSLQSYPLIVADGAGGAIVAWHDLSTGTDYDIYAQRLNSSGVPIWAVQGVLVCTALGDQYHLTAAPDGFGGVLLAWTDFRNGNGDVYAQRVSAAGAGLWGANGVALTTASGTQELPQIVFLSPPQVSAPPLEAMAPIVSVVPTDRRKSFFVLVADNLRTLDGNAAFLYGVNLVVATKDLPQFPQIYRDAHAAHERLYASMSAIAREKHLV